MERVGSEPSRRARSPNMRLLLQHPPAASPPPATWVPSHRGPVLPRSRRKTIGLPPVRPGFVDRRETHHALRREEGRVWDTRSAGRRYRTPLAIQAVSASGVCDMRGRAVFFPHVPFAPACQPGHGESAVVAPREQAHKGLGGCAGRQERRRRFRLSWASASRTKAALTSRPTTNVRTTSIPFSSTPGGAKQLLAPLSLPHAWAGVGPLVGSASCSRFSVIFVSAGCRSN